MADPRSKYGPTTHDENNLKREPRGVHEDGPVYKLTGENDEVDVIQTTAFRIFHENFGAQILECYEKMASYIVYFIDSVDHMRHDIKSSKQPSRESFEKKEKKILQEVDDMIFQELNNLNLDLADKRTRRFLIAELRKYKEKDSFYINHYSKLGIPLVHKIQTYLIRWFRSYDDKIVQKLENLHLRIRFIEKLFHM